MPGGSKVLAGFVKPLVERLLRVPRKAATSGSPRGASPMLPKSKGISPSDLGKVLDPKRLQHGTRHLSPPESNLLPQWAGKSSPKAIEETLGPILKNPDRVFTHQLGKDPVTGYAGKAGGKDVVVFVYSSGPRAGRLASSVHPTPQQMTNWGL